MLKAQRSSEETYRGATTTHHRIDDRLKQRPRDVLRQPRTRYEQGCQHQTENNFRFIIQPKMAKRICPILFHFTSLLTFRGAKIQKKSDICKDFRTKKSAEALFLLFVTKYCPHEVAKLGNNPFAGHRIAMTICLPNPSLLQFGIAWMPDIVDDT